ncbi:MAG: GNAT family N-acetyltransferase [Rickettsiales bacterium]|nr:GNAT family N-acetyltransferase [Rickettsiales bacterium]
MQQQFLFESQRLKARHFTLDDFSNLSKLHSYKIVVATTSGDVQSIEETKAELSAIIAHNSKYGFAQMAFFDHHENFVGRCGIIYRAFSNDHDYSHEIRYAINHSFWGLGIGTEMFSSYLDYIFNNPEINIDTVTSAVRLDGHDASSKILTKLGFHYTENKIFLGNGKETKMYEIKKSNWLKNTLS